MSPAHPKLVLDNLNGYVAQNLHKLHDPWLTDGQLNLNTFPN